MDHESRSESATTRGREPVGSPTGRRTDRRSGAARPRRKAKISVTVDEDLWREVHGLLAGGQSADSASAAVEQGLSLWVANQRLARALEATYAEDPATRPTDEEVARAAGALGL